LKKYILLILFFISGYLYSEDMTFIVYGVGVTDKQYPSLDWPQPLNEYEWKVCIVDIDEEWYGYVVVTTLELKRMINFDGYVKLEVEDDLQGKIKKVGGFLLIKIPKD